MITWGQKANTNKQQVDSLGAHASGITHTFARFRTGSDGASLHPLQRTGQVSAASHQMGVKQSAAGMDGLGSAQTAPAAWVNMTLPPLIPIYGNPRDPKFRV